MNNVLQIAWLIPLLPLLGFLVNGLGRKVLPKTLSGIIGSGVVFLSFLISVYVLISQIKSKREYNPFQFEHLLPLLYVHIAEFPKA